MSNAAELQAIFRVFDEAEVGHVVSTKLGTMLRASGLTPTEARVGGLVQQVDEKGGTISFDDYISMVTQLSNEKRIGENEIVEAFRVFDTAGTGFVQREEIFRVLTSMGETLDAKEVDVLLKEADAGDGRVDYVKLAKVLVS